MDTPLMTNLINLLIGLATLGAVIVALFAIRENRKQSREDWLHSQQLAIEERQHQSRPIVVPLGEISHHTQDGNVDWEQTHQISPPPQPGPPGTTDAGTRTVTQEIMLLNMGDGVAFNVHSILYGPMPAPGFQYISWNNGPIQGKSPLNILCTHGTTALTKDAMEHLLGGYPPHLYHVEKLKSPSLSGWIYYNAGCYL